MIKSRTKNMFVIGVILLFMGSLIFSIKINIQEKKTSSTYLELEEYRDRLLNEKVDAMYEEYEKQKELEEIEYQKSLIDKDFEVLFNTTVRIETGNFKSRIWLEKNNPAGIKCGNQYCYYYTQEQGLEDLRIILKPYYEKYGLDFKALRTAYTRMEGEKLENDIKEFTKIYAEELVEWERNE